MSLPNHVAIIMDGNGRWAKQRKHNRFYGHLRGARAAKNIITEAVDLGIKNLTLFTFSTENWYRPSDEINFLMKLLVRQLRRETAQLVKKNVRFNTVGELERLPVEVRRMIAETKEATAECNGMNLCFALSFGGRQEITGAMKALAERVARGELAPHEVNEAEIANSLESSFLPDPDLLVRTSGEHRLSNFFLWSSAYSEIYFTDKYWPDFSEADFQLALDSFSQRERRFGRVDRVSKKDHECRTYQ